MNSFRRHSGASRRFLLDPIVLAALGIHGVVLLLSSFPILDANTTYVVLESYALIPIAILAGIAPWIGLPPFRNDRERLFWGLWSTSLFFLLVVEVMYLIWPGADYSLDGALGVDLLYVLFYLPLVLSVLIRPDRPRTGLGERKLQVLEFGGAGVFVLAVLTYFVLIPRTVNPPEYESWVPSFLMYWVFDAFLLLTLFYLRQTSPSRDWKILYSWLTVAPACWVVTEMMELNYHIGWDGSAWPSSYLDVLWYLPWLAITLAGRMRHDPLPSAFGAGAFDRDESEVSRSLGRPGWLILTALVLPIIHYGSNLLGLLDPSTRTIREVVILITLALLLAMAALHQKFLEATALALTRKERKTREREELLAAALEQSHYGVLIADAEGVVRHGNRVYAEMEGGLDVIGEPLGRVLPSGLATEGERSAREALALKMADGVFWEGRTGPRARGEEGREELITVSPVRDRRGRITNWILVRQDVTYLNRLERQFRQAQRGETAGALARGLARRFHDLLTKIHGHGEFLREELADDSAAYDEAVALLDVAGRASELASHILAFSREGEGEKELLDLGMVVREAVALLRPTLPSNIRVVENLPEGGSVLRGTRHELVQLVLNLATNAVHAMEPSGGTLEVTVSETELEDEERRRLGLAGSDSHLVLDVDDTGPGMPDEVKERIFDPFFTTKDPGSGIGLGLHLARETVKDHGGAIRVTTEPGRGTRFRIFFSPVETEGTPVLETSIPRDG
jgi:PAS domain S-box-containing protein